MVIVPDHLRAVPPMFPDPVQLTEANVIPSALAALEALDGDANSKVYRIADVERSALTGHSQGGITGLLAIAKQCVPVICTEPFTLPASVRAGALFGTNSVQMGSATPVETAGFAVALLQGSVDGRALPENAALTYETLEPTRALLTFEGLNHFAITNDNKIPGTNEDPNAQTVDQAEGTKQIALWTALWLHAAIDTGSKAVAEHWLFTAKGSTETGVSLVGEQATAK